MNRLPEQTGTNFSADLQRSQRSRTHSECSDSRTPTGGTPGVESIPEHAEVDDKPTRAPDLKVKNIKKRVYIISWRRVQCFQVDTFDDLKRAKKMLSKRMASDTDLWLTLQKTQER